MRYVLEGRVQPSGTSVRVNAQLIDAATGAHLWADQFDADADRSVRRRRTRSSRTWPGPCNRIDHGGSEPRRAGAPGKSRRRGIGPPVCGRCIRRSALIGRDACRPSAFANRRSRIDQKQCSRPGDFGAKASGARCTFGFAATPKPTVGQPTNSISRALAIDFEQLRSRITKVLFLEPRNAQMRRLSNQSGLSRSIRFPSGLHVAWDRELDARTLRKGRSISR